MEQSAQFFFSPENRVAPLGIVAMEGAQELADKIEAPQGRSQAGGKNSPQKMGGGTDQSPVGSHNDEHHAHSYN